MHRPTHCVHIALQLNHNEFASHGIQVGRIMNLLGLLAKLVQVNKKKTIFKIKVVQMQDRIINIDFSQSNCFDLILWCVFNYTHNIPFFKYCSASICFTVVV